MSLNRNPSERYKSWYQLQHISENNNSSFQALYWSSLKAWHSTLNNPGSCIRHRHSRFYYLQHLMKNGWNSGQLGWRDEKKQVTTRSLVSEETWNWWLSQASATWRRLEGSYCVRGKGEAKKGGGIKLANYDVEQLEKLSKLVSVAAWLRNCMQI